MGKEDTAVAALGVAIAVVGLGTSIALAGPGNSCVLEVERDDVGIVWYKTCPQYQCPPANPPVNCADAGPFNGPYYCGCGNTPPTGCIPAIDMQGVPSCVNGCNPPATCGTGQWKERSDGSGFHDWQCPACQ